MTGARGQRAGAILLGALAVGALAVVATGCTSSSSATPPRYYVSLGDSYAVGYQPSPVPGATPGYTAYVATATHLRLANFGCAGATSVSILNAPGCSGTVAASSAVAYDASPQATAAEAFIRAHKGSIGLVTVSIGGNDVTKCATALSPIACFFSSVGTAETNITALARGLRSAAGPGVPIIGLTYPDVLLGLWVHPARSPDQALARISVTGFQSDLNPALEHAYDGAGARFVDITAATGAYAPLFELTTLDPYGEIPVAVAQVCKLTWYCTLGSIHANTEGYTFIGRQIVAEYAKVSHP